MEVIYGILNWNRDCKQTILSLPKGCDVIICSNVNCVYEKDSLISKHCNSIHILDAVQNISTSKNKIIDKSRELRASYLFLLEDDIIVKDTGVFNKYIDIMLKYDLGITMYSFDKMNRAMGTPNPSLKIKLDDKGDSIWISRYSCTSCWGIDLNRTPYIEFNNKSVFAEHDIFLKKSNVYKHIPFYGFYIDLPNSDTYFDRVDYPTERVKTKEQMDIDKKYITNILKISMVPDQSADEVINYIRTKIGV